jgi:hypothetical protein
MHGVKKISTFESLYASVCKLPVTVEALSLSSDELATAGGWVRRTTTVELHGAGSTGRGEDVNYSGPEQELFAASTPKVPIGKFPSFDAFSHALDEVEHSWFDTPPAQSISRLYRRWAFESAGLMLALNQAGTSLAELWGIEPSPFRFVASTGLGNPASTQVLTDMLKEHPDLEFKIDYSEHFHDALLEDLAKFRIACVDFKAHYHGDFSGPPVDADRYCAVARALPQALLEDAGLESLPALHEFQSRLSWDYPIRSAADVLQMPATPWLNIKPSRFGMLSELLRVIELAKARGIQLYGGGQFELGVGRLQAQELASLLYPDGPNDLAPSSFHG